MRATMLLCLPMAALVAVSCNPPEEEIGTETQLACNCDADPAPCCCTTPILIDTAGDGIALTSWREGVEFPMIPARGRDRWAWTEPGSDDAWLSIDRNDNGVIDRGSELFGPDHASKNGFLALSERDSNGDDLIDAQDVDFHQLRLWQDLNHDGAGQLEELQTLADVGIVSIDTRFQETRQPLGNGNAVRYLAPLTTMEGSTVSTTAYDVLLSRATADERKESGMPDPLPWEGNRVIPLDAPQASSESSVFGVASSISRAFGGCDPTLHIQTTQGTPVGSNGPKHVFSQGWWTGVPRPLSTCPSWAGIIMRLYERQNDGTYEEKMLGVPANKAQLVKTDVSRVCAQDAGTSWKAKIQFFDLPPGYFPTGPWPSKLSAAGIAPCRTWTVAMGPPCD